MSADPKGRGTLVVTGAARGIGAAVARLAAAQGWAVAVNYSHDEAGAAAVAESITRAGGRAQVIRADVADEAQVVRLFETAERALGPIGALVNNAGIIGGQCRVDAIDAKRLQEVFAINVTGAFLCAREAVRRLSTRHGGAGGAIVNISSRAAEIGGANEWVHYAASKGAIDSMTVGLAREVGAEGVRVNAVSPGLIDTEIHARNGMPDRLQRMGAGVPIGRAGTADEVAEVVVFLLGAASSYMNGAIVPVGGGR